MSKKTLNPPEHLPFSIYINAGRLSRTIAQSFHRLESETEGDDYIPLSTVPDSLGIESSDLVFLLVCGFVPAPELLEDGLFFYRFTLLAALRKFATAYGPVGYVTFSTRGASGVPLYREGKQ